jgi:hypothetical protein
LFSYILTWLIAISIIYFGFTVDLWFLVGLFIIWLVKLPRLLKKTRITNILVQEFQYEFGSTSTQAFTLNRMERESRKIKWNEFEFATVFMTVMVNSLMESYDLDKQSEQFVLRTLSNAKRLFEVDNKISEEIFTDLHNIASQKLGIQL